MTTPELSFKTGLANLAREGRGDGHPSGASLIAYRKGELVTEEKQALQDHLSMCPDCVARLRDLKVFPEPRRPVMARFPPGRMAAVAALLLASFGSGLFLDPPVLDPPVLDLPTAVLQPLNSIRGENDNDSPSFPAHQAFSVILTVNTPREFPHYWLEISTHQGESLVEAQEIERNSWGTFSVLIPRGFLQPGRYRLKILGAESDQRLPVEEYSLRIQHP